MLVSHLALGEKKEDIPILKFPQGESVLGLDQYGTQKKRGWGRSGV